MRCKHQVSVTPGTIMHKSHTPLQIWFWAILLAPQNKRSVSALFARTGILLSYGMAHASQDV